MTEDFPKYLLNPELELGGKFDRVDLAGDKLTLIDYKTGKYKEDGHIFKKSKSLKRLNISY